MVDVRYWCPAGRSLAAVRDFMAARARYADALSDLTRSLGVEERVDGVIAVQDVVIGFRVAPEHEAAPAPDGYRLQIDDGRTFIVPASEESAGGLADAYEHHGQGSRAVDLCRALIGQDGPIQVPVDTADVQGFALAFYGVLPGADGGWLITGLVGMPDPYDAIPVSRAGGGVA